MRGGHGLGPVSKAPTRHSIQDDCCTRAARSKPLHKRGCLGGHFNIARQLHDIVELGSICATVLVGIVRVVNSWSDAAWLSLQQLRLFHDVHDWVGLRDASSEAQQLHRAEVREIDTSTASSLHTFC
eukprot:4076451-Amphidinium_carterae.1